LTIRLRGHHLLCLLGYRGKGYSDAFCANMTAVYETLRNEPDHLVELIEGPDDLCRAFPADQPPHCDNRSVFDKDRAVLAKLGLAVGDRRRWSALCARVAEAVEPGDISVLCANCRWEPLGLCSEGVGHIRREPRLRPLPDEAGGRDG